MLSFWFVCLSIYLSVYLSVRSIGRSTNGYVSQMDGRSFGIRSVCRSLYWYDFVHSYLFCIYWNSSHSNLIDLILFVCKLYNSNHVMFPGELFHSEIYSFIFLWMWKHQQKRLSREHQVNITWLELGNLLAKFIRYIRIRFFVLLIIFH